MSHAEEDTSLEAANDAAELAEEDLAEMAGGTKGATEVHRDGFFKLYQEQQRELRTKRTQRAHGDDRGPTEVYDVE